MRIKFQIIQNGMGILMGMEGNGSIRCIVPSPLICTSQYVGPTFCVVMLARVSGLLPMTRQPLTLPPWSLLRHPVLSAAGPRCYVD